MHKQPYVFWEVDAQVDFMLPGGKLYVPGAENIIPKLHALVQAALQHDFLLVSSADAHAVNDPEFKTFPPHCIAGTPGAQIIPEGLASEVRVVPSDPSFHLPGNILESPQILLEKQHLDVFTNSHASELVAKIPADAEFIVFGVVTEFCVKCAAAGLLDRQRKVFIVEDAIETLQAEAGRGTLAELESRGAIRTTTAAVLTKLPAPVTP